MVAVGRHASEPKTSSNSPTGIGIHHLLRSKRQNYLFTLMSIMINAEVVGRDGTHMTAQTWCYTQPGHKMQAS